MAKGGQREKKKIENESLKTPIFYLKSMVFSRLVSHPLNLP